MKKKKIKKIILSKMDTIPNILVSSKNIDDFASATGLIKAMEKLNEIIEVLNEEKNKS